MNKITEFLNDDSGTTAIEYALLASGIGIAVMAVAGGVGTAVKGKFNTIIKELGGAEVK